MAEWETVKAKEVAALLKFELGDQVNVEIADGYVREISTDNVRITSGQYGSGISVLCPKRPKMVDAYKVTATVLGHEVVNYYRYESDARNAGDNSGAPYTVEACKAAADEVEE